MSTAQHEIDEKAKRFLRALQYYGGEATTTDIRKRTGLSRSETQYRFDKLEELGLIEVSYADVGKGQRKPPKVAHLSGEGRREISRGLIDDGETNDEGERVVQLSKEEFQSLREEIDEVEKRLDVLTQNSGGDVPTVDGADDQLRERVETMNERIDDLAATVGSMSGGDVDVGSAPAVRRLDERVSQMEEDVGALEEYVYEWTGFAETYFLAIRRVLEEKMDVNMDSYLQMAAESEEEM